MLERVDDGVATLNLAPQVYRVRMGGVREDSEQKQGCRYDPSRFLHFEDKNNITRRLSQMVILHGHAPTPLAAMRENGSMRGCNLSGVPCDA